MAADLVCWNCGKSLQELSLPMRRLEECPACHVDLQVCRMCQSYDPATARRCRERDAEEVKEKERANFCDYFKPGQDAYRAGERQEAQAAKAQLDALFGLEAAGEDKPSEADRARAKLEELFGMKKPDE